MTEHHSIANLFSLVGKTAIITGASGSIGGAIALGFAESGANVALTYNSNRSAAQSVANQAAEQGVSAGIYQVPALDEAALSESAEEILNEFGTIDVLVNCAGGNIKSAMTGGDIGFFDLESGAIRETLDLNFMGGAVLPCLHFGKRMAGNPGGGSIINIGSMNSYRPLEGRPAYAASKAAVSNFTQWLASHVAKHYTPSIRVNAIAPGFFPNERMRSAMFDEKGEHTERAKRIINLTPMGRLGNVEDLVGTAIWYATDASRFVTGTTTPVDGGFNAYAGV